MSFAVSPVSPAETSTETSVVSPRGAAPPGRSRSSRQRRTLAGLAGLALAGGVLLTGCGSSGSSVSCSGSDCRATVTSTPTEVSQPTGNRTSTRSGRTTSRRPRSPSDGVDFGVAAMGPGWVDIDDDGRISRVPQGGTFVEDGSTVRLESSDGRTAVLSFRRR